MTEIRIVKGQIWQTPIGSKVQVTFAGSHRVAYIFLSGPQEGIEATLYWRDFTEVFTLVDYTAPLDQIKEEEVWIDKLYPEYMATIVSAHRGIIVFTLERDGPWPDDDLCVLREQQFREMFVRRSE